MPPGQVWINGKLVDSTEAAISVFDHGLLYGDGVFEGIRAYQGRVFKLGAHLKRLEESARAIRLDLPYTLDQLAAACRQTLEVNGLHDGYIRLVLTRGAGALGIHPFTCRCASAFIIATEVRLYPQALYDNGLAIITASTIRNHPAALSPRIKSLNYLNNILAKIEAIDAGVLEAVMLNHQGYVAECTADNLLLVKDGVVTTPPTHAGALEGVTATTVLALAKDLGIPTARQDLTRHDLYTADEMFLTGTAAEVIGVTEIDKRPVGDGQVGPITKRLLSAFRDMIAQGAPED
ncbi:MAG: branched-chain-amino-acid transaminase [Planctomycetota bacterium]